MNPSKASPRSLPSVDLVLRTPAAAALLERLSAPFVTAAARALIAGWRAEIETGEMTGGELEARLARLGEELARQVDEELRPSLVQVINATGVVIHTNLGRAPWPEAVVARAVAVTRGYSNLEYELERGERGRRETHVGRAAALFGAEAALVVNNNAAAVLLVVDTLARGRETIVSRGELVEIGGSFRIPDVIARTGSTLREVGTTNRTRLGDYEAAINDRTGLLLKVHPSNYRILGFTASVSIAELAGLAQARAIPLVEDLGSGALADLPRAGVRDEPTAVESLAAGADLVTISGDKLLGGPQAGIILGRRRLIDELRRNPLYRALRPDKVTLAALDELFTIYASRDPWQEIPVLRQLALSRESLELRTQGLIARLRGGPLRAEVVSGASTVGGGAAPLSSIATPVIALHHQRRSAAELAAALRRQRPAVVARLEEDRLVVDLRTVREDEEEPLLAALVAVG